MKARALTLPWATDFLVNPSYSRSNWESGSSGDNFVKSAE